MTLIMEPLPSQLFSGSCLAEQIKSHPTAQVITVLQVLMSRYISNLIFTSPFLPSNTTELYHLPPLKHTCHNILMPLSLGPMHFKHPGNVSPHPTLHFHLSNLYQLSNVPFWIEPSLNPFYFPSPFPFIVPQARRDLSRI